MNLSQYLTLTSSLVHEEYLLDFAAASKEGRWADALKVACKRALTATSPNTRCKALHACGDLCLIVDDDEAAEGHYQRANRTLAPREGGAAWSWRSAALQQMLKGRLELAATSWLRVCGCSSAPSALHAEALTFLMLMSMHLGLLSAARSAGRRLSTLCLKDPELRRWRPTVGLLNSELKVAEVTLRRPLLSDLLCAGGGPTNAVPTEWRLPWSEPGDSGGMPFISYRLANLQRLGRLALGDGECFGLLLNELGWGGASMRSARQAGAVELFRAAVAGERFDVAQQVVPLLQSWELQGTRHQVPPLFRREYLLCMARLREAHGRVEESYRWFKDFVVEAMEGLNGDLQAARRRLAEEFADPAAFVRDEISARLPAKYRRAYDFMLSAIDRRDLTIREVAASVGVTERALQIAFRSSIGESPSEVLRRARMQHIRRALTTRPDAQLPLMDVASRYGVKTRSTVASGFKKYFSETPTDSSRTPIEAAVDDEEY